MRHLGLLLLILFLTACQQQPGHLLPTRLSKELVVVLPNGPMTYYVNAQGEFAGPEYDLSKMFAEHLSSTLGEEVRLRIVQADNIAQVIPILLQGKAHLAAANLSITPLRRHLVRFGPPYQDVQQQVVYNRERHPQIKSLRDLTGMRGAVSAGTSFAERLAQESANQPELVWDEVRGSSDELLEQVASGVLDYTVADSTLVSVVRNYHPNLAVAFNLGPGEQLAWAFPKGVDEWLYLQAQEFFKRIRQDGRLRIVMDRYYGHATRLKPLDTSTFLVRLRTVLPKYLPLFKQAQDLTGIDWRLLAAIGYQESHWDNFATSPTGVRGLMMLTEATADRLGVSDRLDPKQSIVAGARYLVTLKESLPERIQEPDRTWLALAAYNIGIAHLEDARVLAQRQGLNPDVWADVKKTLPLLKQEEYFTTVKYGYAQGGAPVIYVESIRAYYSMLEKHESKRLTPALPNFSLAWLRQQLADRVD